MNRKPIHSTHDLDPAESSEWLEALQAVIRRDGPERAHFLLENLVDFLWALKKK